VNIKPSTPQKSLWFSKRKKIGKKKGMEHVWKKHKLHNSLKQIQYHSVLLSENTSVAFGPVNVDDLNAFVALV